MANSASPKVQTKRNAVAAALGIRREELPMHVAALRWRADGTRLRTIREIATRITDGGEQTSVAWVWEYCAELEARGLRPRHSGGSNGSGPVPPPPAPGERAA